MADVVPAFDGCNPMVPLTKYSGTPKCCCKKSQQRSLSQTPFFLDIFWLTQLMEKYARFCVVDIHL